MITQPHVSAGQRRVLEALKVHGDSTIPALAAELDLNVETVRHHVRGLESSGYVARRGSVRSGPGRPEHLYGLEAQSESLFPRLEGAVLAGLAAHLKATGNEAVLKDFFDDFINARRPAAFARVAGLTGEARLEEVARILTDLGFMATTDTTGRGHSHLRLCHCPLLELVEVSRVPCRAELSFIRELLGEPLTRLAYIPSGDASCSYQPRSAPAGVS